MVTTDAAHATAQPAVRRRSPQAALRRVWFQVHLWIGVACALFVIPLGLSGSALVFGPALNRAVSPHRYAVSGAAAALSPSAYLDAAQRALGARARVSELRLPAQRKDPVVVTGRLVMAQNAALPRGGPLASLSVWMEPKDARVLDVADPRGGPVSFIHRLHGSLAIAAAPGAGPGWGRALVGWLGIVLAVSSLSGLWLWWPRGVFRWTKLGGALAWRRTPSTMDNLHHLVGFWISLPLLLLSLTGVYIAFPQQSHALFGLPAPAVRSPGMAGGDEDTRHSGGRRHEDGARRGNHEGGPPPITVDQAANAAGEARPGAVIAVVTLPHGRVHAYRIAFAGAGERPGPSVLVDAATGQVAPAPPEPPRGGDPFSRWVRQTHQGEGLGPVWTWVAFLTGLAPTVLAVTGVALWLLRTRRRALARAA